jgi:hypothetical protein
MGKGEHQPGMATTKTLNNNAFHSVPGDAAVTGKSKHKTYFLDAEQRCSTDKCSWDDGPFAFIQSMTGSVRCQRTRNLDVSLV